MDPQHCCRGVYVHDHLEHPRLPSPHGGDQRGEQQGGSETEYPVGSSQLLGHVQQVALDDQMLAACARPRRQDTPAPPQDTLGVILQQLR
jgi:hypothetical protein